jgi:hypothetical protein
MSKVRYILTLTGGMHLGASAEDAVPKLAKTFKTSLEKFQPLLREESVSKNLNVRPELIAKLEQFLGSLGVQYQIEKIGHIAATDNTQHSSPAPEPSAESLVSAQNEVPISTPSIGGLSLSLEPMEEKEDVSESDNGGESDKTESAHSQFECPKCKYPQEPSETCDNCGIIFAKYQSVPKEREGPNDTALSKSEKALTLENEMISYVGENSRYYRDKFNHIRAAEEKFKPSWHWYAFLAPFYWALYRKLWGWSVLFFFLSFTWYIFPLFGLIANIVAAISANFIYYKHVKNRVFSLKKKGGSSAKLSELGGASWKGVAGGIVASVVISAVVIGSFASVYMDEIQEVVDASTDEQNQELMKTPQGSETVMSLAMAKMTIKLLVQSGQIDTNKLSFDELIEQELPAESLIDGWGTPFKIKMNGESPSVRSAGPDKLFNTADDIE